MKYALDIEVATESQRKAIVYLFRQLRVDYIWDDEESTFSVMTNDAEILHNITTYLVSISRGSQ